MENTAPKFFCFILMPFDKDFDDIYQFGIKDTCKQAGTYCERVDEQIFQETILDRIYNQIAKADLIIADMTGRNPNVFYEVGYAHALNKPTVLLTQNAADIPFDLKHFPHIVYNKKIGALKEELLKRLLWFVQNINDSEKDYKTELDIYVDNKNLSMEDVVHEYPHGYVPNFEFTIHNKSLRTYESGEFQIGIISKDYPNASNVMTTALPTNEYLHMLPYFDTLWPDSYTSCKFVFGQLDPNKNIIESDISLRVYSEAGSRDYKLRLRKGDMPKLRNLGQK